MSHTLKLLHSGKVREVYAWGEDKIVLLATDRISAFDVILPDPIPDKGKCLTQMARYWFNSLPSHFKHHAVSYTPPPEWNKPEWAHRITIGKRTEPLLLECVVRGYLAGSGWKDYEKTGAVQGQLLPRGLKQADQLPEPLFTPTTKAQQGHDEYLTEEEARKHVGDAVYEEVKTKSLEIYRWAHDLAKKEGVILADTKFEFGYHDGELILIDEILTPDSSRFWPADEYHPGQDQKAFDKQFVRDYLLSLKDWDRQPPGPTLPPPIIEQTRARYQEAYERITGQKPTW